MPRLLSAMLLGALSVLVLTACTGGTFNAEEPTPLVAVPALLAQDGTSIPLPEHVADGATDAQRDDYARKLLGDLGTEANLEAARSACASLDGGAPPILVIGSLASPERSFVESPQVAYAGALAYCPAHRSAFDNVLSLDHGGLR